MAEKEEDSGFLAFINKLRSGDNTPSFDFSGGTSFSSAAGNLAQTLINQQGFKAGVDAFTTAASVAPQVTGGFMPQEINPILRQTDKEEETEEEEVKPKETEIKTGAVEQQKNQLFTQPIFRK